jgi:hypothetical protein
LEVIATAKLKYKTGENIIEKWERLTIEVKFKDGNKLFKKVLTRTLADSTDIGGNSHSIYRNNYKSWDEFYDGVEKIAKDKEYVEGVVETMVKRYFRDKSNKNNKNYRSKNTEKMIKELSNIEVNVKIK